MAGSVPRSWPRRIARIGGVLVLTLVPAGFLGTPASGAARHPAPGAYPANLRMPRPGPAVFPGGPQPGLSVGNWRPEPGRSAWPVRNAPSTANGPWRHQPTPNLLTRNGLLDAVSCRTTTACAAVGSYLNGAGIEVLLVQMRTGGTWHAVPAPVPPGALFSRLIGVSCTAADACTAVGDFVNGQENTEPLAEQWDGTSWRIEHTPVPFGAGASAMFAVSCSAANACTAVGGTTNGLGTISALAERWNGTAWRLQTTPTPGGSIESELFAVSCSSPRACTAGGSNAGSAGKAKTLAERWNGTAWRVQPTPVVPGSVGSGFSGLSCATPRACAAAGSYLNAAGNLVMLAEAWDGTAWRVQATPAPGGTVVSTFLAVSCSGRDACTAAGAYIRGDGLRRTLAERWDGTGWHHQVSPSTALGAQYSAVWCTSAPACTTVGIAAAGSGLALTLGGTWHGAGWHTQATPNSLGASASNSLDGVSCVSGSDCMAAGFGVADNGSSVTLAEHWNGTGWRTLATPNPATSVGGQFFSVSCTSASACTGVGFYRTAGRLTLTLAERWNGTSWRIQNTPNPAGSVHGSFLNSVSCSAPGACAAVGWYFGHAQPVPFAETWNGTSWRAESAPHPSFFGHLFGVSCAAPDSCMAVGDYGAAIWNGTNWRFQPIDVPAGSQGAELDSVSCASATRCTAVGSYFNAQGLGPLTLAEGWDGKRWAFEAAPNPPNAERNGLNGVSCTAPDACTAVGTYALSDFSAPTAYAETWNGTNWKLQTIPAPAATSVSALFGASCTGAGCTGVGTSVAISGLQVTLAVRAGG